MKLLSVTILFAITEHLWWLLKECITAGGHSPKFQSVFSSPCSTTYQTLSLRSMQTLYYKNSIVIAHTLL